MANENRNSPWCQGDIFVLRPEGGSEQFGVVASHDCDLYADPEIEPGVEYVPVTLLKEPNGQYTFGKSPRTLHCRTLAGEEAGAIELVIRARAVVDKRAFFESAKAAGIVLLDTEKVVFRNWLAARYARSAFPNAFEDRLSKLRKKIEKMSERNGKDIRAIYFDLDDGQMIERLPGDPYSLRIHVVYEEETDEDDVAYKFAQELGELFTATFYDKKEDEWHDIVVYSCEATSSYQFPLVLANSLKPWRVDHRSFQALPGAIYPEPAR